MKRMVAPVLLLISAQAMADVKVVETKLISTAQSTRFIINLTSSPTYKVFTLTDPPRVVVDLNDTRLTSTLTKVNPVDNPVQAVRSGIRNGHNLRVVLDVKDGVTAKNFIMPPSGGQGYRLVIDLEQQGAVSVPQQQTVMIAEPPEPPPPSAPSTMSAPSADTLAKWMEEARQSMAKSDYSHAIALYTKILEYPDHPYRQDAQEYLGLARERNGQLAHAKAEYETYLKLYPKGEGADRVKQRLTGLLTAQAPAQAKLPKEAKRNDIPLWNVRGGFSQFYRRDVSSINGVGTTVNQSALDTDLDVIAQLTQPGYEMHSRFTGGYRNDFLDSNINNPLRITSLYVDAADHRHENLGRIGRQSLSRGGVLGRFDGMLLSHQLMRFVKLNLVSGYPVDTTTIDKIATQTLFYGVNADFGTFANTWDFNTFAIQQVSEDMLDRRAVGGEVRYFKPSHSALGLVDYDISYQTWNMILLLGNWLFPDNSSLNVVIDHRKSPILTTRNALIGQVDRSLSALRQIYTDDQIRQLAQDRSAESHSYTLSLAHPINDKLQISGDLTLATLSGTPASGGVEATPDSGNDWNYSVQLMGSGLLKAGDIAIIGIRMDNNDTSDTTSLNINTRYPVNQALRINPWVRIDYRRFASDNSTQWTTTPALRINYMMRRTFNLELEVGGEWVSHDTGGSTDKTTGYYVSAGYRADF